MESVSKRSVSKTTALHFIKMENPNGQFMGYSTKSRAQWYISKNLAKWVGDNAFRLNFIPKGNGKGHIPYYNEVVENRCVCCGTYENMTRHHVFPYMFKSQLPIQYKSRSNYDILPVCSDCHEEYERKADLVKRDLKNKVLEQNKIEVSANEVKRIKSVLASRKFLLNYDENPSLYKNVPLDRVLMHEKNAEQYIDENILEKLELNNKYWVNELMDDLQDDEEKLLEFVKMWRQHFVDSMNPKFLPKLWVVDMELEVTNEYLQEQGRYVS